MHRPRYDDWSYPKGKRQPGEHLLRTAIREVSEETGLRRRARPAAASVGVRGRRRYQARQLLGRPMRAVDRRSCPNDEVDELAWLPVAAARERLTYERDIALLDEFRRAPGPAPCR